MVKTDDPTCDRREVGSRFAQAVKGNSGGEWLKSWLIHAHQLVTARAQPHHSFLHHLWSISQF